MFKFRLNSKKIINRIIPPATREYREGFVLDYEYLDGLNAKKRNVVSKELKKLFFEDDDVLVIEVMDYLKLEGRLEIFKKKFDDYKGENLLFKVILGKSILELDSKLTKVKMEILNLMDLLSIYDLSFSFYVLAKLQDEDITEKIESYRDSENLVLSGNSRDALNTV